MTQQQQQFMGRHVENSTILSSGTIYRHKRLNSDRDRSFDLDASQLRSTPRRWKGSPVDTWPAANLAPVGALIDLAYSRVEIADVLEAADRQSKQFTRTAELEFIAPIGCPPIQADRDQLITAVHYLLQFAAHATGPGDRISLWAEPYCNAMVCIGVGHSGPGLSRAELKGLFEEHGVNPRGQRVVDWRAAPSAAREIARAHSGDLWVRNHVKFGTTFYLWVPVIGASASVATQNDSAYGRESEREPFIHNSRRNLSVQKEGA